jgi:hypothetical protein
MEKEIIKKDCFEIEHQNNLEEISKNKKKQKARKEFLVYYSSYGYIKIFQIDVDKRNKLLKFIQYKQIPFRPEECLKGTIYFEKLIKNINIRIKTFFNQRKIFTIEKIGIYSPLHLAIQKLFDQIKDENKKEKKDYITSQSQYRLYSCYKRIHQLNQLECIYENDIRDNELLLYLPINDLSFSEFIKGDSIRINKEGKIATKVGTDEPQYILGNIFYSFGKHYFEVNLLTEPKESSVTVGVATKKNPIDKYLYDVQNFYGLILSDFQKITIINGKRTKKEYSKEAFTINDIVGVLVEFKKEGVEIKFYKNKICLGAAFSKIKNEKIFYPALILGYAGSKVQISNQIDFP